MKWSAVDVFALSLFGFTGSGQFAYLALEREGVAYVTAFAVILGMNLRYVPMCLSEPGRLGSTWYKRGFLGHFVSDESYALEMPSDAVGIRFAVRLGIATVWIASSTMGAASADMLPGLASIDTAELTFPINALLFSLAIDRSVAFTKASPAPLRARIALAAGAMVAGVSFFYLATSLFWLLGVGVCLALLYLARATTAHGQAHE